MLTEHFHNTQKDTGHYSNDLRYVLSLQNTIAAFEEIKTWEGYAKTPLHSLDSLASDIGVKNIYFYSVRATWVGGTQKVKIVTVQPNLSRVDHLPVLKKQYIYIYI